MLSGEFTQTWETTKPAGQSPTFEKREFLHRYVNIWTRNPQLILGLLGDWFYTLPKLADCGSFIALLFPKLQSNIVVEDMPFVDKSRAIRYELIVQFLTFQLKADVKRFPGILEGCKDIYRKLKQKILDKIKEEGTKVDVKRNCTLI